MIIIIVNFWIPHVLGEIVHIIGFGGNVAFPLFSWVDLLFSLIPTSFKILYYIPMYDLISQKRA